MQRVEAARRMFPSVYIDPVHCAGGLRQLVHTTRRRTTSAELA